MPDQPQAPRPDLQFPADMAVSSVIKSFATNLSNDGKHVWLWLRYPMMTLAADFTLDNADKLAIGLARLVDHGKSMQDPGLQRVERKLLGLDGNPIT